MANTMNGNSNNGRVGEPTPPGNVQALSALLERFNEAQSLLLEALETGDMERISPHDQAVNKAFDQIMEFQAEGKQAGILLVEFLLDQLQVDQSSLTERIKSKIVETVQKE